MPLTSLTDTAAPPVSASGGAGASPRPAGKAAGYGRVPPEDAGLRVTGLAKSFGDKTVLRDISLSCRQGEVIGLLGPNGAGKTTCFYAITGLVRPDAGRIEMDGRDVTRLPLYRRARLGIGYLPQEASIFRGLTTGDNIRAALEMVEPNRERREARLNELLDEFSIAHLRRTPALALSGGERRRCEIARALATNPRVVLLDEPFAGIDPIAIAEIRDLTAHLKDRGIGVLITDHNVRETLDIIDRAYIVFDGRILLEGSADDVMDSPEVRRVYLGERFTR
ncbi:LPS export ABC transporter ATP-binding protein [Rhodothalassium salexigens]|uniref:LPS export ABC transporter ATP-binding protein n=1 Tax=Rhodothalassium salexigens TaxID=1086 RepID=UPI003D35643C